MICLFHKWVKSYDIPNKDEIINKYNNNTIDHLNEYIFFTYRTCTKCGKCEYKKRFLLEKEPDKWKFDTKKEIREQKLNNILNIYKDGLS